MRVILILCLVLIKIIITASNKIYVRTNNGLAISEDDGQTWTMKLLESIGSVNPIFVVGSRIYVAVAKGLAISDDDGRTWAIKTPKYKSSVKTTAAIYAVGNKVYVGTPSDLAVSDDGGRTWMNKTLPSPILGSIYVHDAKLYLGLSMEIAVSDDNGQTFSEFPLPYDPLSPANGDSICVSDTTIYVASGQKGKLFMSTDNGTTWKTEVLGTKSSDCGPSVFCKGRKAYLGLADGIAISEDDGKTWTVKGANVISMVCSVFAEGNRIYVGTMDGLEVSEDGGETWTTTTTTTMNAGMPLSADGVQSIFVVDTPTLPTTTNVVHKGSASKSILNASVIVFSTIFLSYTSSD